MKFKASSILIVGFFCFTTTHAQQDTSKSVSDTIQYYKGAERYYLNNKKIRSAELEAMLNRFNASAIEFKAYKKRAVPGTLIILTGVTAGVLAFTKLNKGTHFFTPYTITLFLGDLVGIPLMISANKHLKRSVKLYNQSILR
jgi:hypothetical protein